MNIPFRRRLPRLTSWWFLAGILTLLIALVSPVQLPVVIYKLSLVSLAAVVAYWLDRALFPYARPDGYLVKDWRCGCASQDDHVDYPIVKGYKTAFVWATLRRAIIVSAVVIGVATGL